MSEQGADPGNLRYKRVLLKISGEALMGDPGHGWRVQAIALIAHQRLTRNFQQHALVA